MPSLNMEGPFDTTELVIDEAVSLTSPGNFALGRIDPTDGGFIVLRVGRSDTDINGVLREFIGRFKTFKFSYAPSAEAAFEKECVMFHEFKPMGNKAHPQRPKWKPWKCPLCYLFE